MKAREFTEALDQPYYLHWERYTDGDVHAVAELPANEGLIDIIFQPEQDNKQGPVTWEVEFYRNDDQDITGEGDQFRVFATVLQAINEFVDKYKPMNLSFTATKKVEPGQKSQSRASLYDALVKRYAQRAGYRTFRGESGDSVVYHFQRITPNDKAGVAEGAMKDLDIDLEDQQWDSVVGYIINGLKTGMDTDRIELALYKWAGRELYDVDQALEDHGFRDIADLADHIEQHDGRYVPPSDFRLGDFRGRD